ncbi:MAG TPA: hypothetical protein PK184_00185 [Phycisphaerae bacterium]|nr:hypothetical protein [Phycisphaerae bacterium]
MRTVYAIQFRLPPRDNQGAEDVVTDMLARIRGWVVGKYDRAWQTKVEVPFDGTIVSPLDGHSLRSQHQSFDDVDLLSLDWAHPHDHDTSSAWHTSVVAGRHGNDVEIAIAIRITTVQMTMRPVGYDLGRPRIVTDLIDSYDVKMNNWSIPAQKHVLKTADVEPFANDVLLAPGRTLPVIVLTPDAWNGRFLIDPDETFDAVKGFAHVAVMETKWAAFKLTDVVDRELSCFNGAARIYWPAFTLKSNPFDHRLYLPGNLEYWRSKGVTFGKHLFRMLAAISAFRFVEGPAIRAARKVLADVERSKVTALVDEVKKGRSSKEELETQVLEALAKIEELTEERDQLKADLEAQKAAWGEYQAFMANEAQSDDAQTREQRDAAKDVGLKSVRAALNKAKADFEDTLQFLESAEKAADESPFKNPDRVYELFEALAQVAMEWRENKGNLRRSWKDALAELGFEYKDKVSQTSKTKWADDYTFTYNGRKLVFEQHITIGAKQPDKCLSVHFYRDDANLVLVIGHCGRHLTNTKS